MRRARWLLQCRPAACGASWPSPLIGVGDSVAHVARVATALASDRRGRPPRRSRAHGGDPCELPLDWTVVRPPRLMSGQPTGRAEVGTGVETGMRSQLDRADLARVLVDLALDAATVRTAVTATAA
ncbi:MAG: NAD(P)H-binding protein [Chloroflexota bacterium]